MPNGKKTSYYLKGRKKGNPNDIFSLVTNNRAVLDFAMERFISDGYQGQVSVLHGGLASKIKKIGFNTE